MFINYMPDEGITISSRRQCYGYASCDVIGLVEDISAGVPGCCPLGGAQEALEDGSLWGDRDQSTLEAIHSAIRTWEAGQ